MLAERAREATRRHDGRSECRAPSRPRRNPTARPQPPRELPALGAAEIEKRETEPGATFALAAAVRCASDVRKHGELTQAPTKRRMKRDDHVLARIDGQRGLQKNAALREVRPPREPGSIIVARVKFARQLDQTASISATSEKVLARGFHACAGSLLRRGAGANSRCAGLPRAAALAERLGLVDATRDALHRRWP